MRSRASLHTGTWRELECRAPSWLDAWDRRIRPSRTAGIGTYSAFGNERWKRRDNDKDGNAENAETSEEAETRELRLYRFFPFLRVLLVLCLSKKPRPLRVSKADRTRAVSVAGELDAAMTRWSKRRKDGRLGATLRCDPSHPGFSPAARPIQAPSGRPHFRGLHRANWGSPRQE